MSEETIPSTVDDILESLGEAKQQQETSKLPQAGRVTSAAKQAEERALVLLGSGIQAEAVAAAIGVTPSRIAQLLSNREFSDKVAELRYESLQKHNLRDDKYDTLEDKLLAKLDSKLFLLTKPTDMLRAISIVNAAKRRGQTAPAQITNQQNIVNLILPTVIAEKFAIDINNQVTKAGEQSLITMPSGNLLKQVEDAEEARRLDYGGSRDAQNL